MVSDQRLRFDFTHFRALSKQDLTLVSQLVNQQIQNNLTVKQEQCFFDKAKEQGAIALFSEKYEGIVRTIKMGNFSYELCGGTHIFATGEIGFFVIVSESGIAAGTRRIEALTGMKALNYIQTSIQSLNQIASILKANSNNEVQEVEQLIQKNLSQEKELKKLKQQKLNDEVKQQMNRFEKIGEIRCLFAVWKNYSKEDWKMILESIQTNLSEQMIVIVVNKGEKQDVNCLSCS